MSEKVKKPYLRPNLQSQGEVPPLGDLTSSPDIWCSGIHPVADFENFLKQEDSYAKMSEEVPVENMDNYFYVRCKNGSDKPASMHVELYWTNASVVCWPSDWNPLKVDNTGETEGNIPQMQPNEIGVVEAPFVWHIPTRPASGDEYCFIARLFSDDYPNRIPSGISPVYMASLLQNDLLWSEQNIGKMEFNPNVPLVSKSVNLNVPTDTSFKGGQWMLAAETTKLDNWDIQVQGSRTDSQGKEILLTRCPTQKNIYIGNYNFVPGFFSSLLVNLYPRTGETQPEEGAKIVIHLYYDVPIEELDEAYRLKAFNDFHVERVKSIWGGNAAKDIHPVLVGEYTILVKRQK